LVIALASRALEYADCSVSNGCLRPTFSHVEAYKGSLIKRVDTFSNAVINNASIDGISKSPDVKQLSFEKYEAIKLDIST